jgi:hypothetical protein
MTASMLWSAANGAALLLLIAVVRQWSRARPEIRRRAIPATLCVVVAAAAMVLVSAASPLPTAWITLLHEGRSLRNVQQLYGLAVHHGAGFYLLADWLSGHDVQTLPAVVTLNLGLWVINTILLFFFANWVLGWWWASLAFAVIYACNPNTVHAAFSETPAMLWTTHFWLGCVAAAVIDDEAHATPRLRRLALAWLALLVILAALLRTELLVLGLPALAVAGAKAFGFEGTLGRAVRRTGELLRSILAGPLGRFLAVAVGLVLLGQLSWPTPARWLIDGFEPLNLSFLNLPWALGVFLPAGVIVLFALGLIHATRRWSSFCLLPITVLILFKVYVSAAHGTYFETFRYLTFVTPAVIFLALFGIREAADWAGRWGWPAWWKRPALLLLLLACTLRAPSPGLKEFFGRGHQLFAADGPPVITAVAGALLARNEQTEVRYMLDLIGRYPTCVFLVRAMEAGAAFDTQAGYRWAAFGRPVSQYREFPPTVGDLPQAAAQVAPDADCVLFYRSLDCNLVAADGCTAETQGRTALEEQVLESLPYSDVPEYGAHRPEIRLGVYSVAPPGGGGQPPAAPR